MIKGLLPEEENIIKSILTPYKKDFDFYYYGSRVKGNFEKSSDLDVLIHGKAEIPYDKLETLKFLFDNSDLPFVVNFADFYNIDEKFYDLIKKDLVKVFV